MYIITFIAGACGMAFFATENTRKDMIKFLDNNKKFLASFKEEDRFLIDKFLKIYFDK
jgi:hypothetical protein